MKRIRCSSGLPRFVEGSSAHRARGWLKKNKNIIVNTEFCVECAAYHNVEIKTNAESEARAA